MALDGANRSGLFGNLPAVSGSSAQSAEDRPKAQVWLNVGYYTTFKNEQTGEEEQRFVSLPAGIPLDTTAKIETKNIQNKTHRAFTQARNDLMDIILEHSKTLDPGADDVVHLQIQLRRVNDDAEPISEDENPFSMDKSKIFASGKKEPEAEAAE